MLRKILLVTLGIVLIASVVFLGFLASNNSTFVIWFGLAAALLAPSGIALISYAFTASSRDTLEKLAAVPEISKLINEAKSQEEKIRLLEEERKNLVNVIQVESRKQTLEDRKESLENDAAEALTELEAIDGELESINAEIKASPVQNEIARLHDRLKARKRGDIVLRFGSKYYSLNRDIIISLPMGRLLLAYLRLMESITKKH